MKILAELLVRLMHHTFTVRATSQWPSRQLWLLVLLTVLGMVILFLYLLFRGHYLPG